MWLKVLTGVAIGSLVAVAAVAAVAGTIATGGALGVALGSVITITTSTYVAAGITGGVIGGLIGFMQQSKVDNTLADRGDFVNTPATPIVTYAPMSPEELDAAAQNAIMQNPNYTPTDLQGKEDAANANRDIVFTPPSVQQMQQNAQDNAYQDYQNALQQYEELIAKIQNNQQNPNVEDLEKPNQIENPFNSDVSDKTDQEKEEDIEITTENTDRLKEELTFDKSDFENIEPFKVIIGNTMGTVYVKTDIKLISEDEEFQSLTKADALDTYTYTDENGTEHAVSRAYDADGNPLDKVILSTQVAYVEVGINGSFGYAKLTGTGSKYAYAIEGYGNYQTVKEGYENFISGNYMLTVSEEKETALLGTNDDMVGKKEYSFRDSETISFSEVNNNSLSDVYKEIVTWACNVMRELNIQSYNLDLGDAELVIDNSTEPNSKFEETWEEDGVVYTYDSSVKILTKEGNSYTVKDMLINNLATMKELVDQGFEPISVNGEEFTDKEDVEDAITAAKPKFEIKIDEWTGEGTEPFEKDIFYTDEDGMKYFFITKCSDRYHIITEDGEDYSLAEALDGIYTIEELIDAGLDCKKSPI